MLDVETTGRPRQRGDLPLRRGAHERLRQPVMLWRAEMNARQLAIAVSMGASARPIMIEAATLLADHEIGAQPEDDRLQQKP